MMLPEETYLGQARAGAEFPIDSDSCHPLAISETVLNPKIAA